MTGTQIQGINPYLPSTRTQSLLAHHTISKTWLARHYRGLYYSVRFISSFSHRCTGVSLTRVKNHEHFRIQINKSLLA